MTRGASGEIAIGIGEVALIVISAAVALGLKHRVWLSGIALGLLIHAALLLAFDLVAERRGAVYLEALRPTASPP